MRKPTRQANASARRTRGRRDMSQRRFIRLFSDEVGLTPKSFSRIHSRSTRRRCLKLHRSTRPRPCGGSRALPLVLATFGGDQPSLHAALTAAICLRRQQPSIRLASTRLPSGRISLGDGVRLLHAPHAFCPRHQDGCFRRFDGAACSNSQRDCRHTFVVRYIADEDRIILAEAIPFMASRRGSPKEVRPGCRQA